VWKFKSNVLAKDPDIIIFTGDYKNTAVFNYLPTRTKKIALTCNLEVGNGVSGLLMKTHNKRTDDEAHHTYQNKEDDS
jgi:hypothetical protein